MFFYGRQLGRPLSAKQNAALVNVLPVLDISSWNAPNWPTFNKLWLEIGFGTGEHLLELIKLHPNDGFIGVEVFQNGLAHFLCGLDEKDYSRCRVFPHPVGDLFGQIPSESLDGIFIMFPDPWHKRSHHKRRLVQKAFLDECYRCLKPDGELKLASDHFDLVRWILHQLTNHDGFQWEAGVASVDPSTWPLWPESWPLSRYHQKATLRGENCAHFIWKKKKRCGYLPMVRALETLGQEAGGSY